MRTEDLNKLAAIVGVEPEKFKTFLSDEFQDEIKIPALYTETEKDQFGSNKFKEGRKAEKEIIAKDMAKQLGVDIEEKDPLKVASAYADLKIKEAKLPIDEQLNTLKSEKEKLQSLVKEKEKSLSDVENDYKSKIFKFELKQKILSNIPDDTIVPKEDLTELFLLKNEIAKDEDGKLFVKRDGKVLKDNLENYLSVDDIVKSFSESYIKKDGMGGGDGTGGTPEKFTKMSDFAKWAKANNMKPTEDKALEILSKKKSEDFVYDEIPDDAM